MTCMAGPCSESIVSQSLVADEWSDVVWPFVCRSKPSMGAGSGEVQPVMSQDHESPQDRMWHAVFFFRGLGTFGFLECVWRGQITLDADSYRLQAYTTVRNADSIRTGSKHLRPGKQ